MTVRLVSKLVFTCRAPPFGKLPARTGAVNRSQRAGSYRDPISRRWIFFHCWKTYDRRSRERRAQRHAACTTAAAFSPANTPLVYIVWFFQPLLGCLSRKYSIIQLHSLTLVKLIIIHVFFFCLRFLYYHLNEHHWSEICFFLPSTDSVFLLNLIYWIKIMRKKGVGIKANNALT